MAENRTETEQPTEGGIFHQHPESTGRVTFFKDVRPWIDQYQLAEPMPGPVVAGLRYLAEHALYAPKFRDEDYGRVPRDVGTVQAMALQLGYDERTVRRVCTALEERGLISTHRTAGKHGNPQEVSMLPLLELVAVSRRNDRCDEVSVILRAKVDSTGYRGVTTHSPDRESGETKLTGQGVREDLNSPDTESVSIGKRLLTEEVSSEKDYNPTTSRQGLERQGQGQTLTPQQPAAAAPLSGGPDPVTTTAHAGVVRAGRSTTKTNFADKYPYAAKLAEQERRERVQEYYDTDSFPFIKLPGREYKLRGRGKPRPNREIVNFTAREVIEHGLELPPLEEPEEWSADNPCPAGVTMAGAVN